MKILHIIESTDLTVIPMDMREIKELRHILGKNMTAEEAISKVLPLISSPNIIDAINNSINDNVSPEVFGAIDLEFPMITQRMKKLPMLRDENIEGTLSTLGHKDERP